MGSTPHIVPHEIEVRDWRRRHVRSFRPWDIDDLIQEAYYRLCAVEFTRIFNGRGYLFTVVRHLLLKNPRRTRIAPIEHMGEIDMLRIPSEGTGPHRKASARQELERLAGIAAALPAECRRAFWLQNFTVFRSAKSHSK